MKKFLLGLFKSYSLDIKAIGYQYFIKFLKIPKPYIKMMLCFICLVVCLFGNNAAYSQSRELSSLMEKMKQFEDNNLDSALFYNDHALALAKALKDKNKEGILLNARACYYKNKGFYQLSEEVFLQAIRLQTLLKDAPELVSTYKNFSTLKRRNKKYGEALEYSNKALEIIMSLEDYPPIELAKLYNTLGLIYDNIKDYPNAKKYYHQALTANDSKDAILAAKIYENIGDVLEDEGDFLAAIAIYENNLTIYSDLIDLSRINNVIGVAYWNINDFEKAIKFCQTSEKLAKQINNELALCNALINLGDIYREQNQMTLAKQYYDEVKKIYDTGIGGIEDQKYFAKVLADFYKETNEPSLSIQYLEKVQILSDSIYQKEQQTKLAEQHAKLGVAQEKIKTQDAEIRAERYVNHFYKMCIAFFVAVLIIISLTYFIKQQQKQKIEQQRAFDARIENELITNKLKGEKIGRKRIASELHDDISTILVAIKRDLELGVIKLKKGNDIHQELSQTIKIIDKAYQKVRNLSHKLEPALLDWQDDMEIHIRLLEDNDEFKVEKSMDIVNPIPNHIGIEISKMLGVLLHNIEKHSKATEVFIEITSFDEGINLIVVDNGIGFDKNDIEKNGVGLKSLIRRIDELQGTFQIDTRLGTTITIDIPFSATKLRTSVVRN